MNFLNTNIFTERETDRQRDRQSHWSHVVRRWSGGVMVLGKLSVPERPTNLDISMARAYCACSRCGLGLFGHFFSRLSFLFSFSLSGRWVDIDCNTVIKGRQTQNK